MRVQWATNEKAMMANDKHFNGAMDRSMMDLLVNKVIRGATHVGQSDRSNGKYEPAKIIWGVFNGKTYAVVLDSKDIKRGIATVISFYDINETTRATKAARFGMKGIK